MLPDLLRDLAFPAVWAYLDAAHGPREASRLLAKILSKLETRGAAGIVPVLHATLASGAPLTLARIVTAAPARVDVPAPLRDLDIASGCAADHDGWLTGAPA